jgi:RHS repeat-associated protein
VADVDTTPTILQVHTDQIDRPLMMTDDSKSVVWEATWLPFGGVDQITGSASLDLRFPGQWFQIESGLHYNWHRHYDPTTGRYLQADPLGLDAGVNRWAYAANSPLTNVDPTGRSPVEGRLPYEIMTFGRTLRFFDLCGRAAVDFDTPGHDYPQGEMHIWDNGTRGPAIPMTTIGSIGTSWTQ